MSKTTKRRTPKEKSSRGRKSGAKAKTPYPSLQQSPTPAERRAALERQAAARGVKPIEDYDKYLSEVGDFWPAEEDGENFDLWLRLRRSNRLPQGCSPADKRAALEMFADMHGVKPIDKPAQMKASFWPADESTDEMLAAIRAIRRGKS